MTEDKPLLSAMDAIDALQDVLSKAATHPVIIADLALTNAYLAMQRAYPHVKDNRIRIQMRGSIRQIAALKGLPMEDAA